MILAGDVKFGSERYCFASKVTNKQKLYYVYSLAPAGKQDDLDARIVGYKDLANVDATNYLLGIYSVSNVTGKVKYWGDVALINVILENLSFASNYAFSKEDIVSEFSEITDSGKEKFFSARDKNLAYTYKLLNSEMIYVTLSRGALDLDLCEFKFRPHRGKLILKDAARDFSSQVLIATLKTIRISDLDAALDMSWYHVDGEILKKYSNVKSRYEFETRLFTPIIKAAVAAHDKGEPLVLSLDTETSGLNTFNLAEDNPSRSHCVSVQLSWEDNQGVAIFNDMEHFQNVDIEYTMSRLGELFAWYEGDRTISYWDTDDRSQEFENETTSLKAFKRKEVTVQRSWFFLVGHNFLFDRRTCYQTNSISMWFDADTRQMAFVLCPQTVRGSSKLKVLTRRVFGHETPELTDILGKGNEDKYRYLVDEEVANLYGCADVDYTRKLFFVIKELMPERLWKMYLKQDVVLPNILAISEYYGMNTYKDKVEILADAIEKDLEILRETAYSYVGAFQDYNHQRLMLESAYSSGLLSEKEYQQRVSEIKADPNAVYRFEFKGSEFRHVLYEILHYPIKGYTEGKIKLPKVDKYVMKKLIHEKRSEHSTARTLERDILSYGVDRNNYERLRSGSKKDQKAAEGMCLLSAKEFNKLEYPMALLLQKYAELNKEYTSYYKPIKTENLEGKLFKNYDMARIETRRIANPGQTMKGNLKALVRSYGDDYYCLDYDMSQVEYRIMLSLSGFFELIERMKNPERDFHTETASMVYAIPPHKVSRTQRKKSKSVSFGVPYGLGDPSLCETMHGEITPDNLVATRIVLQTWKEKNAPIVTLLETSRAEALEEWVITDKMRAFFDAWKRDPETKEYILDNDGNKIPIPVSRVTNKLGFYRIFNVDGIGQTKEDKARRAQGSYTAEESSIRRKAGNYAIQSFAAELFRTILTRFYWRCVKEGIEDKIIWHMLIHDELFSSVHKSLHPFYIFKLVRESCMVTMKGHTKYFVGINIGDTWGECKADEREAPVLFVERMIEKWDNGDFAPEKTPPEFLKNGDPDQGYWFDHPWDFIKPYREKYISDRIGEVIRTILDIDNHPIDVPVLLERFDNYTVRAYVNDYAQNGTVDKENYRILAVGENAYDDAKYDDAVWSSRLETWALSQFPEGKEFIDSDGNLKYLKKVEQEVEQAEPALADDLDNFDDLDDLDDLETLDIEESYWSFDSEQLEMTFEQSTDEWSIEHDLVDELNLNVENAKSINDLLYKKPAYERIQMYKDQLRIPYVMPSDLKKLKEILMPFSCSTGYLVVFTDPLGTLHRWLRVTDKINLAELDNTVSSIHTEVERRLHANRV